LVSKAAVAMKKVLQDVLVMRKRGKTMYTR